MVKVLTYPEAILYECKNRIAWLVYHDKTIAEEASIVAQIEATKREGEGEDLSFQTPGEILCENEEGRSVYKVCIP